MEQLQLTDRATDVQDANEYNPSADEPYANTVLERAVASVRFIMEDIAQNAADEEEFLHLVELAEGGFISALSEHRVKRRDG